MNGNRNGKQGEGDMTAEPQNPAAPGVRRKGVQGAFPGMPDRVAKLPPKATAEPEPMTLDQAIARSVEILQTAIHQYSSGDAIAVVKKRRRRGKAVSYGMYSGGEERVVNYGPREIAGVYGMYSGGNDSVVLPHLLREYFDGIIHVNTGTAIAETTQHVREVVPRAWNRPLHELKPKVRYRDLVLGKVLSTRGKNKGRPVWAGFPGPGQFSQNGTKIDSHAVMYQRLKGEPLETFRAKMVGGDGNRKKVMYVAGTRWGESERRLRLAGTLSVQGGIIWVAPLIHWTDEHMHEYRARHRCAENHEHAPHHLCFPDALPLNEVTVHIHQSGDCTCGSFAKEGEKEEISFFYPAWRAWIDPLEREVEAAGIPACRWGQRPPGTGKRKTGKLRRLRRRILHRHGSQPADAPPADTPWLCAKCVPGEMPGQIDMLAESAALDARLAALGVTVPAGPEREAS